MRPHFRYIMQPQSLKEILIEFMCKPPGLIAVETLPVVGEVGEHPTKCATEPDGHRTIEEIGLLLSHILLMRRVLSTDATHMFLVGAEGVYGHLKEYLAQVGRVAREFQIAGVDDFLLFSVSGYCVWRPITRGVIATNEFNGAVSYLIGRPMMEKVVGAYEHLKKGGMVYPIDGLLGFVLKAQRRWALGPALQPR